MSDARSVYFVWLKSEIAVQSKDPVFSTDLLLEQMYQTPFIWAADIPTDSNRAQDGQGLREKFILANPEFDILDLAGPCTFLEFLYALADRMDYWALKSTGVFNAFWKLCGNCGLDSYTDEVYLTNDQAQFQVDGIMQTIMRRNYKPNGEGGLFPLNHPKQDQRYVEIWYQMNAYLLEDPTFS